MKVIVFFIPIFLLTSCREKELHQASDEQIVTKSLNVSVDNEFDPICEMKTTGHISDTIHYESKIYGFCSTGCKEEFAKNPKDYLSKLNK